MDNITFPTDNEFNSNAPEIKKEPQNYFDLPENEFDATSYVETQLSQQYLDVKPNKKVKKVKRKKLKDTRFFHIPTYTY